MPILSLNVNRKKQMYSISAKFALFARIFGHISPGEDSFPAWGRQAPTTQKEIDK
jgi:hypothetical protein